MKWAYIYIPASASFHDGTQDDPNLAGYNVDERVASFVKEAQEQASHFATNHIMFTMGSDFNYQNSLEWYKNLDKLVHYVNKMVRSLSLSLFLRVCLCVCIQDDPRLEGYNADQRAFQFLLKIGQQAMHYHSRHIMLTMGSDFNYQNAREYFKNLDKLIYHTNRLFVSPDLTTWIINRLFMSAR